MQATADAATGAKVDIVESAVWDDGGDRSARPAPAALEGSPLPFANPS